jgi:hypothetical protein
MDIAWSKERQNYMDNTSIDNRFYDWMQNQLTKETKLCKGFIVFGILVMTIGCIGLIFNSYYYLSGVSFIFLNGLACLICMCAIQQSFSIIKYSIIHLKELKYLLIRNERISQKSQKDINQPFA